MARKKKKNTDKPIKAGKKASVREKSVARKANELIGKNGNLTPKQRKKKEEIFTRRMEVAKLMTEYGYNDRTIAKMVGVNFATISRDRKFLEELWIEEAVHDVDKAKQQLIRRKEFLLDESRRAWEKSKGRTKTSKKKDKRVNAGAGSKKGSSVEKEETETVKDELGNPKYLELFDKVAEDIAELQGVKKDRITSQVNIVMPSLPDEFKKYGLNENEGEKSNKQVQDAEEVDFVDINNLEEDDIRSRQERNK